MPLNYNESIVNLTVAVSGTVSTSGFVQNDGWLSLYVPVTGATSGKIQGCLGEGLPFADIKDKTGTAIYTWPSGTGDFIIGGEEMSQLSSMYAIRVVLNLPADTGAKTIKLLQKLPNK